MTAAIGVERAEQTMLADHLAQRLKRRCRPFFLDQQHRIDLTRRIVQRDDQVHRRQTFDPGVARSVLVQQHPRKRPAWTPCWGCCMEGASVSGEGAMPTYALTA